MGERLNKHERTDSFFRHLGKMAKRFLIPRQVEHSRPIRQETIYIAKKTGQLIIPELAPIVAEQVEVTH